jgi:hypothetical protein
MRKISTLIYIALLSGASAFAQPRLSFNKSSHSFGQIEWKKGVTVEYGLTNTGDRPLLLSNVTASCACTDVEWPLQQIAPGGKGTIRVTFDAKTLGHFEKFVGVYSNAEPHLVYLSFDGEVVSELKDYSQTHPYTIGSLRLDRNVFDFPDVNRGETSQLTFGIVNLSDRPYEPVLMHLPRYLSMEKRPSVLQKGEKGTVTLTLDSRLLPDLGLTQSSVYLARFVGDKVGDDNELTLSAVLLPDFSESDRQNAPAVSLSEEEILLPATSKKRATHDIYIGNNGRSPLVIRKLQVFNSAIGVSLKSATLAPGEATKLHVTVHRSSAAKRPQDMRILMITNDPARPKVVINVKTQNQ